VPETLRALLQNSGFEVLAIQTPPYSLVGITQVQRPRSEIQGLPAELLATELERGKTFAEEYPRRKKEVSTFLEKTRQTKGKVALFGAGHVSCTFVNLLELRNQIEFVADDHPHKRGLFMPGSHLPILGSTCLVERGIRVCLTSSSQETERKIATNCFSFVKAGGEFVSIFSGRPTSMPVS
jgi:hypothetical protein